MSNLFSHFIFSLYGRIYLFVRYKSREEMDKALKDEYDGSYSEVGRTHALYLGIAIMLLLTGGMLVAFFFGQIFH